MDKPYENTRSKLNLQKIDFSVYGKSYMLTNLSNDNLIDSNNNTSLQCSLGISDAMDICEPETNEIDKVESIIANLDTSKITELKNLIDKHLKNRCGVDEFSIEDNLLNSEVRYLESLSSGDSDRLKTLLSELYKSNTNEIPLKFKILTSNSLDINTKKYIIERIDRLNAMDDSDNEYCKLLEWKEELEKIPFDKYTIPMKISDYSTEILKCKRYLDEAVCGHEEAKIQIIQIYAQYLTNPQGNGKILALQGPMGNGKTTLIKKGLSRALGKPFYFVALGGISDSSFLTGHLYTYEGARPGIITQALQKNQVLDGIIYFDELDKVSNSFKGQEIYNNLCHLTDSSQNMEYQDKYFSNINLDLSRNIFVFSFNDKSKINPILMDRLVVVETKGYNNQEKIEIAKKFLISEICNNIGFQKQNIIFNDKIINYIIDNYTSEQGVRRLKQAIEKIISHINLIKLIPNNNLDGLIKIKTSRYPIDITEKIVDKLLKRNIDNNVMSSLYI